MKTIIVRIHLLLLFLIVTSSLAQAKGPFGLGAIIGDPTGVSAKYYLNKNHAVDAAVAWDLGDRDALGIHVDYLIHVSDMVRINREMFPLHFGIGTILYLSDKANAFGVRVPVGLNYNFQNQPIDLFVELAGILALAPDTDFDIQAALGVRYYF